MVTETRISLSSLPMEELTGVIHMYPWYGGARKELCRRMSRAGGETWGAEQYGAEALHIADRRSVDAIRRRSRDDDWSDRDVERILKSYIAGGMDVSSRPSVEAARTETEPAPVRRVSRGPIPGDYFSQEAYDEVRQDSDNALSKAVAAIRSEPEAQGTKPVRLAGDLFCTETLAGIYAEQGYFDEAKQIYSRLLLTYPEKNAYFASLIEKMDVLLNN